MEPGKSLDLERKSKPPRDLGRLARKAIFIILILIGILIGIFSFGANASLLKSSTAVLKIDTTKATINDILGGIEFLPISTSTATESEIWTQSSYNSNSSYLEAKSSLENLTQILEDIDSYVIVEDFSLARVFTIHDYLYLANGGFECWSDHIGRDYIQIISSPLDTCPINRFMECFGKTSSTPLYYSRAYYSINTMYLSGTTSLNTSDFNYLSELWSSVLRAANTSTLRLNIDPSGYKSMFKLLCDDDYIYLGMTEGNGQKRLTNTFKLGICSLILTVLTMLAQIYSIVIGFVFWVISLALLVAMFSLSFSSNIPASKYINQSEGIRAKSAQGGLVAYFVVIVVLNLVVFLLFFIGFSTRKQKRIVKPVSYKDLNYYPTGSQ